MSDEQPTQTGDLGAMPDPQIEPGEPNPGGVDALAEERPTTIPADLGPTRTRAVEEAPDPLKEELSEGEDTSTEATKSDGDDEDDSPATRSHPPEAGTGHP